MRSNRWTLNTYVVVAVYFVQGAALIAGLAEFLLTRNAFKFSWIQLALLAALAMLTWSIKPIYGFLTDLLPLFGRRRKSYLLLVSLLPFAGYLYLALHGTSFLPIALALILANIGLGFADVIVDGLIVEQAEAETIGWYQAVCWRAKAAGIFLASLFSGLLIERAVFSNWMEDTSLVEWLSSTFPQAFPVSMVTEGLNMIDIRFTFILTACLPVISFVLALFLKEPKVSADLVRKSRQEVPMPYLISAVVAFAATAFVLIFIASSKTQLLAFLPNDALTSFLIIVIWTGWILYYARHLIRLKMAAMTLIYAALFLFLWRFTPSFGAPWNHYFLNTLNLSREKIGFMTALQPLAWMIGSFIYVRFLDKLPIKKVLLGTVLISSALSLFQLTLASPETAMTLGSLFFIKHIAGIILMPIYFLVYGFGAWTEVLTQPAILNLEAVLTFFLQMMFIISFLPLLKLAALVTPKGVEATNFAVLMSVMNLGLAFGSVTGGLIYSGIEGTYSVGGLSFNSLHLTIIIGAVTSLLCLLVLPKLRIEGQTRYDT